MTGRSDDPRPSRVRGVRRSAFLAYAREREFDALRSAGAIVSVPRAALGAPGGGRLAVALTPPAPSGRVDSWRDQGRSPSGLDYDTAHKRGLRVRAELDADVVHAPVVHWRGEVGGSALSEGSCTGVWSQRPPDTEEPIAVFDLSSSLAWILAGRVQQLYPREGWGRIVEARVLEHLPAPSEELAPRVDGGTWTFPTPEEGWPHDPSDRLSWHLGLLELSTWRHVELSAASDGAGALRVPDAGRMVRAWLGGGGGPVAWSLEGRIDGTAVWRAQGRRVPASER